MIKKSQINVIGGAMFLGLAVALPSWTVVGYDVYTLLYYLVLVWFAKIMLENNNIKTAVYAWIIMVGSTVLLRLIGIEIGKTSIDFVNIVAAVVCSPVLLIGVLVDLFSKKPDIETLNTRSLKYLRRKVIEKQLKEELNDSNNVNNETRST